MLLLPLLSENASRPPRQPARNPSYPVTRTNRRGNRGRRALLIALLLAHVLIPGQSTRGQQLTFSANTAQPAPVSIVDCNENGIDDSRDIAGVVDFRSALRLATSPQARRMAPADVTGDGKPEILLPNRTADGLLVWETLENRSVVEIADLEIGFHPWSIWPIDRESDGNDNELELIVSEIENPGTWLVTVRRDNLEVVVERIHTGFLEELVSADFDGDGWLDLVGMQRPADLGRERRPGVLWGSANGSFSTFQEILGPRSVDTALSAADVLGEGQDQLLLTSNSAAVGVYRGVEERTFERVSRNTPRGAYFPPLDVDSDGDLDFIRADTHLVFSFNDGRGNFDRDDEIVSDFPLEGEAFATALVDVDRDGHVDVLRHVEGLLQVHANLSGESFAPARIYAARIGFRMTVADFDGDGVVDIAGSNVFLNSSYCDILFGSPGGIFEGTRWLSSFSGGFLDVGDIDSDGALDVVTGSRVGMARAYLNRGGGLEWSGRDEIYETPRRLYQLDLVDLNADSRLDLVLLDRSGVWVFPGNGDGSFQTRMQLLASEDRRHMATADFDGNGTRDVCLVDSSNGNLDVALVERSWSFEVRSSETIDPANGSVTAGDLDGDGFADVVLASQGATRVYRGDGSGSVSFWHEIPPGGIPGGYRIGDIDGDGAMDVVIAQVSGCNLALGGEDGELHGTNESVFFAKGLNFNDVFLVDADRDGRQGILLGGSSTLLLEHDEKAGFRVSRQFIVEGDVMAVGDMDGDDREDIVVVRPGHFGILFNRSRKPLPDGDRDGVLDACGDVPLFLRGDANADGEVDLADALRILGFLYLAQDTPACADAADVDDNGSHETADAVRLIDWLFLGTVSVPPPGPQQCGEDVTGDSLGACLPNPCTNGL